MAVRLAVRLKLEPNPEQAKILLHTLESANVACNLISDSAWANQTFGRYALHKANYYGIKARFDLAAQVVVRCISKVADAYKLNCKVRHNFRPHGSIAYDERILRFKDGDRVSIWGLGGRLVVRFACGDYQRRFLPFRKGEVDLVYWNQTFYLSVVCQVDEPPIAEIADIVGVDLGLVNLATDSDGVVYSGAAVEQKRRRYAHRRRNLQRKKTRSARRKLHRLRGQQARYQRDVNHCISKAIVAVAQRTARGVALEDLQGIRKRVTARRRQRARLANWSFAQLRFFLEYKARLAGVEVLLVDPRNTSRTCPVCGCVDKRNRCSQSNFRCTRCGYSALADWCAAREIRARAVVNRPMVAVGVPGTDPQAASYKRMARAICG
jgi:putative transposase